MWIIEEAVEREQGVETIMRNLMLAIFAAIHTSSNVSYCSSFGCTILIIFALQFGRRSRMRYITSLPIPFY